MLTLDEQVSLRELRIRIAVAVFDRALHDRELENVPCRRAIELAWGKAIGTAEVVQRIERERLERGE